MFSTFIGLIDIQSWWEVPCIAHFCSLFSSSFQLPDFDIEDLEEALLTDADVESEVDLKVYNARLLSDLIVALLKGCDALSQIVAHISPSNYQMFLRRLFRQKCQEYNIDNPFNTDTDFEKLPLRTKILILKYLCDFRLDSADVYNSFANLEADSLRVEPLGYDSKGSAYWYFFGTRLYREDYETISGKGNKSSKRSVWQVICFIEEDWRNLAGKFQRSKNENERALLQQLEENFLPNIPKIFRDKERERRNKLLERRTSSRIKLYEERRLADLYRQQEIEQAQKSLQRANRPPPRSDTPPSKASISEERAKRAERRSRSNSVTSIVSIYASSPEPLTSDLIIQPKETESPILNTTSSKHSYTKLSIATANLHSPASPSSELGSEQTVSADLLVGSDSSKRDPQEEVNEEEANASVFGQLINNSCTEIIGSSASVASSESSSSGVSSRNRGKSPTSPLKDELLSPPSTPPPPITGKAKPKRPYKSISAEIERLLQYNLNMAPTTTKLPGRQTNNSLSSITGPVILPFADTPPKTSSSTAGSKSGDSSAAAGGGGAASSGGRKKKSKAAQVFTETEEVLQIGMHKVLEYIKNHDDAWPFMDPVEEDIAPRYYSIIRRPMDLQKMEEKLDNGEYSSFGDFRNDFRLIVNNCRLYNGQANEYTEMVNNLQLAFEKATKKYFDSNSSDEEPTLEYPLFKEKPFAAGNSGSGAGKSNESTSSSTSGNHNNNNNNSKSSKETKSSKSGGGKKNSNSGKNSSNTKNSKTVSEEQIKISTHGDGKKKEESIKDIKKDESETSENNAGRKQAGNSGSSAKKTKPTEQPDAKNSASENKGSNAKGLKRKRKEKDKSSKVKTKKFMPSESGEEENENEKDQETEKVIPNAKGIRDAEKTKYRSPTPERQEMKKKSSSKSKRKEQKGKDKGKTRRSEKEEKQATSSSSKRDSVRKDRRSRSRSRSDAEFRSVSPVSKRISPLPGTFLTPKKVDKRRETSTPKQKHSKKSRKEEEHSSDQDDIKNKADKTVDTTFSTASPSPVENKRKNKNQTTKKPVHSISEEYSDKQPEAEERYNLSTDADIEKEPMPDKKNDYFSEDSVQDQPATEKETKRGKKNRKSSQKCGKIKEKSINEEKPKKFKQKGKNGKSKKSKSRSFESSSMVSHSNEDELNDSLEDEKNKKAAAEKEIISASKKQPKDFSKYTTLPRDRSASRSFSRSPSPLPSIRDDYSSFSDHSMEFDEADMGSERHPAKQLPARPITPDIVDKYDLIKQRRRNQAAAALSASTPVATNDKAAKAKNHKTQESSSRKKQKTDQPLNSSPSASSILPLTNKTKPKVDGEQPIKAKETAIKNKKKRDHSPAVGPRSHDSVNPVPKWTAESDHRPPLVEKPRLSYKDEKVEKQREPEKKSDPCDEYDFVDDSPVETIAPKQVTPIASPVEKIQKPSKNKIDSSSSKKPAKTPISSSSRPLTIGSTNKQPKQSGANMEALELETEQTLKDINKWLENTPRFSEYSSASNSPSRYIMDDLDAVTAKIDAADFRKPIPLSQLPEEPDKPLIPSPQLSIGPPPLAALSTSSVPSVMSPKRNTPPIHAAATALKEPSKPKLPKDQPPQDGVNPIKETIANQPAALTKPQQQQIPQSTQPGQLQTLPAPTSNERPLLGPPPIIPPHSQKKEPKEPKRKSLKEKLSQLGSRKRETVQHHRTTIDRLQPGKSKGNLISSIQNLNKPEELFPLGGGSGVATGASVGLAGTKLKEVKNSLIVKTDESKPKLSLGTVLNTAEGFGLGQQHEFADEKKENVETVDNAVRDIDKPLDSLNSTKVDSINSQTNKLLIHDDLKAAKAELAKTDPAKIMESPEKVIKAVTKSDKPSATPNLSAWFKAFGGAPKKHKKAEDGEEAASKSSPNEGTKSSDNTSPSDVPLVPSLESPSYPSLPAPRQRKASTGSTVSERSSYSQDPDSPRIGIDERIGVYPAPYPSPMGASPVMTSPKLDDTQKSPYPMNGAIKVGFYQDTTTKSSPEKSCSPRDLPSPYPQYSQHLYTANSGMAANSVYGNYSYGTNGGVPVTATTNSVDTFKSYDQYKQPASQESDYNSSMSPSTNPNSPYHNQQSSPYQQQPNSPYQQQNPTYNQQQPIPSPASSGPLSPYSNNSLAASVQQSPAQSVSGHSPFNPSPTSPYQTPQHQSQSQQPPPPPQKPNQPQQQQPAQHSSKPNTPIHQSPNSPFSQSNHSSPYSQQDPNSPYSQGQLSPFQPMSPKTSQIPSIPQGTTNNSLKLAPPIITPQQAAAAAGVTLPESPVNNLSQQQTSPQHQQQQQQQPQHSTETPGSQLPLQQPQLPNQINTQQNTWNQQPQSSYNQYADSSALNMGTSLPAPAHMHHHHQQQQQQSQSQTRQQQKPQPAHHNVQQMPPSAAHLLSSQQQQQQQPPQQTPPCVQQQNFNNLTPAHTQPSGGQQQHSHLSTLLSSNSPYTSNYGRQAYESTAQSQPQQQDANSSVKNQTAKVPELINLGYNSGGSNEVSNKVQPQHQEVPMNMGAKPADNTKEKEMAKQQQMFELMGAMGYGSPMDISISKSKAFDMFNRAATMTFPRGFPSASGQAQIQPQQQQDAAKMSYGGSGSSATYDQMQTNTNKAHDMSGSHVYGMPHQQSQQTKANQNDMLSAGNLRGNSAGYDQRPAAAVASVSQHQQHHPQQQQQNNMDLSTGYKAFSGQSPSTLMDPALRNLASLSSLYQTDERLLASGSSAAGYYDKSIPPDAHMYGKNLSSDASSTIGSTTSSSALQQMFNTSMATTMAYNAAARDQQAAYGTNYHHHQRSDLIGQGQKVPLNIPSVANPTIAAPETTKPKRGRKKKDTQDLLQQQQQQHQQMQHQQQAHQHQSQQQQQQQPNAAHQGFQSYSGLKTTQPSSASNNQTTTPAATSSIAGGNVASNSSDPSPISLKTANVVPGSAFNFGPGPAGLGLPSSLYGENSPYLDEFRANPNPYPYLTSSHPRGPSGSSSASGGPSTDGSDKVVNASAATASAAAAAVAVAAAAVHQPPPSAASPYHQFLSHPSSRPSPYPFMNQLEPLHQQYIRQEELRAQMMLNQSLGLGAPGAHGPPPGAYGQPGAYHPALGIHKPYDAMNSINRPPWL
ncbi:protein split ends isoform X2 [Wyeomyia smithii]|uniref:protein split ends isoform X2 n=1 Tax=Wyeomyia smithii TaxID=174621 RepID=UPI002467B9AD|nr:protein split ends isoform X2 [Wyeomyia smithii]